MLRSVGLIRGSVSLVPGFLNAWTVLLAVVILDAVALEAVTVEAITLEVAVAISIL